MSKPVMSVALVCGPVCDLETQAMRAALEYFGARVITYWIGRPNDFIPLLSGEDLYSDTEVIVFNFHGCEGKFVMPELDIDVYEEGEPQGDFGSEEILRYTKLDGKAVIGNGCTLGDPKLARAFIDCGCRVYIGPDDYPDGNDELMFVIRLFYEMIQNHRSLEEAFRIARSMNDELSMYKIYVNSRT